MDREIASQWRTWGTQEHVKGIRDPPKLYILYITGLSAVFSFSRVFGPFCHKYWGLNVASDHLIQSWSFIVRQRTIENGVKCQGVIWNLTTSENSTPISPRSVYYIFFPRISIMQNERDIESHKQSPLKQKRPIPVDPEITWFQSEGRGHERAEVKTAPRKRVEGVEKEVWAEPD